jgi:hypothetical protein
MPELRFRAHHFLCTLCFQGNGYSPVFVKNYQSIVDHLNQEEGDNTVIEVVIADDDICAPCPHRLGSACSSQATINTLDQNHAQVLGLKAGGRLTWGQAKQLIQNNMSIEKFHTSCAVCEWKKLGICEKALRSHLEIGS